MDSLDILNIIVILFSRTAGEFQRTNVDIIDFNNYILFLVAMIERLIGHISLL